MKIGKVIEQLKMYDKDDELVIELESKIGDDYTYDNCNIVEADELIVMDNKVYFGVKKK